MDSLYTDYKKTAEKKGDFTAIVFYGKRYSFNKMLYFIDCAANALKKLGVKKGETVTLLMPNTPSAQIAFYAINRLGAIVNLVHPKISLNQLNSSLKSTNSTFLIAYDLFLSSNKIENKDIKIILSKSDYFMGFLAKTYFKATNKNSLKKIKELDAIIFEDLIKCEPIVESEQEFEECEKAVYLPSGGTTDTPKIIMHNNKAFMDLCSLAPFFLSKHISEYKCMYSVLPIFHGFGLCMNMHMCVKIGLTNVLSIKFNPKHMAKSIEKERVNIFMGVPVMFSKLLKDKHFNKADLSSVYDCFTGGDVTPLGLVDQFNDALKRGGSQGNLYIGYGLTETVTVCTVTNNRFNKSQSIGVPLPNTQIKIISDDNELGFNQVGEICIKTPIMMLGYLGAEQSPFKSINGEDWLFTGDLGFIDEDGFLFFKQRIKNMIKVSGVPVFPSEIEEVVERIEGVNRCAAIGFTIDSEESVKLFVEASLQDEDELREIILAECRKNLTSYAIPKIIEFKDALPLNEIGKIDRKKL